MATVLLIAASGAQARIAVGSNYRLDRDNTPGRGYDSVGLAVDPRNARHIVEIDANWLLGQCGYHVSFDGGRTWRGHPFRAPAGFNALPCAVGPHLAEHIDAGIVYGSGRNVYATFASPRPLGGGSTEGKSVLVAISRDGGRRFGRARLVVPGGPSPNVRNNILPTIGVERARRRGPRRDVVYVAANQVTSTTQPGNPSAAPPEDIVMTVSRDAGRSWGAPFAVNPPGENAVEQSEIVVGRDGSAYIAWRTHSATPDGYVVVAKSRDRGRTWTRKRVALVHGYTYTGPPAPPFTTQRTFTASTFPRMAIDPRRSRFVYVTYGQGPPQGAQPASVGAHSADHFINPDEDVYVQRSTDGGATWSRPLKVNTASRLDLEITQTRHPNVSVAPNGRVDLVWQDRRHWYRGCTNTHVACQEARLGDTYYAYSTNHGLSFSRNYRITDRSTNNDVGYDYRFGTYWAYGPVSVPLGNRQLLVGWMESRNGNFQNDNQDIYLARVTLGARGSVPVRRIARRSPVNFSVALSRLAYPGGPEAVLAGTFVTRPWTRVVIVNQRDVSGVLAGGFLARANIAPVLVSPASGLPRPVVREVRRMQPIGAYVVGSESSLSPKVVSDLAAAGVPSDQIVRLNGGSTAGTARLIAEAADRRTSQQKSSGTPAFNAAIIANPATRDAVTAAVLAANRRLPVLYVSRDSVPPETSAALRELNINRTIVIGGQRAVSNGVAAQLPAPTRVGGRNQYATSRAVVAASVLRDVPPNIVYATDGTRPMEAALLGAAVARIGGLQLVVHGGASAAVHTVARSGSMRGSVTQVRFVGRRR